MNEQPAIWEGARLQMLISGHEFNIDLSNIQFRLIVQLLGIEFEYDKQQHGTEVTMYDDATLAQFVRMKGNPLRLWRQQNEDDS